VGFSGVELSQWKNISLHSYTLRKKKSILRERKGRQRRKARKFNALLIDGRSVRLSELIIHFTNHKFEIGSVTRHGQ
jgi:hypothetical protein